MATEVEADEVDRVVDVVHTLRVGKVRYAVGLLWQDVEESRDIPAEARKIAARPGVDRDLFVVRATGTDFGLGRKGDGHAKGMPSLAARLADANRGTWVGIFKVDGGWYLAAVNGDHVQADAVVTDEGEARARFGEAHEHVSEWQEVYCPASFHVDGSREVELADLLTGKSPRLQSVDRVSPYIKFGVAAVALLAALWGTSQYYQYKADEETKRLIAEATERAKQTVGVAKKEVPRPPAPWEGHYKATRYVEACVEGMHRAVLAIPGWKTKSLVCDGHNSVQQVIDRQAPLGNGGGTMNWIRLTLDRHDMRNAAVSPLGADQFQVTWDFPDPERWKPDIGPTPTISRIRFYLQSQFEEQFVAPTFGAPRQDEQLFYRWMDWSVSSARDPREFARILDRIPGNVVNKVSLDLQTYAYKLEGVASEQIPPPPKAGPGPGPGPARAPGTAASAAPQPAPGRPVDVVSR